MKRILLILIAVLSLNAALQAAPGDTTIVQANIANLSWYGNYDTTLVFPHTGVTYRKIIMVFTLGKYTCPGYTYGSGAVPWCGDWDYTVLNYLIKPNGETFELGRLITPYANGGAPRTPYTWKQHYYYDVTDYAAKLTDTATMRILFSGYSGGFTGNIKFLFIEGVPDRTVLDVRSLWNGSYSYGDTTHGGTRNINTHFTALTEAAPAGTQTADLKFTVTGHGSDASNCNEFCSHNYQVLLNGTPVSTKTIWRDNCGANELYPQSGTWLLTRANWCPGAMVYPHHNILPNVKGGMTFNTAIKFDDYVGNGGASYTTDATLIYYGGMNKTTDASLDDIISPTLDENHFRENPINANPVIHVKNTGANPITSMNIQYGVVGGISQNYPWTGTIASLNEMDITLPVLPDLNTDTTTSGMHSFSATITSVNGVADDDATNNTMSSKFIAAPYWPSTFRITFATNNETIPSSSTICETGWVITDMNNTIVASKTDAYISTLYRDTINLQPGFYKLQVYDSSCDGLAWWVFASAGITNGYIKVENQNTAHTPIPLNGFSYTGGYPDDFGCGITQYFTVYWPTSVQEVTENAVKMIVFPNPAQNAVNVEIDGLTGNVEGTVSIIDALGRTVISQVCNFSKCQINTADLTSGMYIVQFTDNKNATKKLTEHIIIAK